MSSLQTEDDSCIDITGNQPQFLEETLSHEEPPDVLTASSEGWQSTAHSNWLHLGDLQ